MNVAAHAKWRALWTGDVKRCCHTKGVPHGTGNNGAHTATAPQVENTLFIPFTGSQTTSDATHDAYMMRPPDVASTSDTVKKGHVSSGAPFATPMTDPDSKSTRQTMTTATRVLRVDTAVVIRRTDLKLGRVEKKGRVIYIVAFNETCAYAHMILHHDGGGGTKDEMRIFDWLFNGMSTQQFGSRP